MSGFGGLKGNIKIDEQTRRAYSRDASIFEVVPQGVITPKDADDLKILLNQATKLAVQGRPISLTARDGGTCMSGGSLTSGWVLDMTPHFASVGKIDRYHKRVTVGGGTMQRDVERAAAGRNLYFAPYPSSHELCGIGGMIGNNASGEKSLRLGPTSAHVDRLTVVLSDGEQYEFGPLTVPKLAEKLALPGFEGDLYRGITPILDDNKHLIATHHPATVKNAAGYALWDLWNEDRTVFNMARLFIGSQGTLGITTSAELKLTPIPKYSRLIVTPVADLSRLTTVVTTAMRHHPAACETFDRATYELARTYLPADAKRATLAEGKALVILTIFEGDDQAELARVSDAAWAELSGEGFETFAIDDPRTIASYLSIRQKSFSLLLDHPRERCHAAAFLEDSIVPLEHYGDFLSEFEALVRAAGLDFAFHGHIGAGSLRLIPFVDLADPATPRVIAHLESKLADLVLKYHGSISCDHNDGLIRSALLERQYGPHMIKLFESVKNLFDPFNIFNPGKKVFANMEYAAAHIARH